MELGINILCAYVRRNKIICLLYFSLFEKNWAVGPNVNNIHNKILMQLKKNYALVRFDLIVVELYEGITPHYGKFY